MQLRPILQAPPPTFGPMPNAPTPPGSRRGKRGDAVFDDPADFMVLVVLTLIFGGGVAVGHYLVPHTHPTCPAIAAELDETRGRLERVGVALGNDTALTECLRALGEKKP